jgi:hypothetical protein
MFDDGLRFVWDIDALTKISANPTPQHLLDASVILRRLLIDDSPLIGRMASRTGLGLKFRIFSGNAQSDFQELAEDLMSIADLQYFGVNPNPGIFGEKYAEEHGLEVNLDKFLKTPMKFVHGKTITVYELIHYVANVGGGAHQGKPGAKRNAELIHQTANMLIIDGSPYPLDALRAIISITVTAAQSIYERLRA